MIQGRKIGVVLPAGGVGKRFGSATPKQLLLIDGVEIYRHCLNSFLSYPGIDSIAFVCAENLVEYFTEVLADERITVVAGGEHRWHSVRNGVAALSDGVEYVLIHDVARPFVSHAIIDDCIRTVIEKGPCIAAKPVTDTVKVVRDSMIIQTIDRETVYLAQTPQAFSVTLLQKGYAALSDVTDFIPTDEASIIEFIGEKVCIVTGDALNDKITTQDDLSRLSQMVQERDGKGL